MTNTGFLLIGVEAPPTAALARCLREKAGGVLSLPMDASSADIARASERHPLGTVVFAPPAGDEFAALDRDLGDGGARLARLVGDNVKGFLRLAQASVRALLHRNGGQIWVLDWDDSFEYHLALAFTPIAAEARAAAVRALAKECTRLGIAVNSVLLQPFAELAPAAVFRSARNGLKAYAMRYKPGRSEDAARVLADLMARAELPFSGAQVSFGAGVNQALMVR